MSTIFDIKTRKNQNKKGWNWKKNPKEIKTNKKKEKQNGRKTLIFGSLGMVFKKRREKREGRIQKPNHH